MKIKHKIQRKLDPSFQAALKLCSLLGLTTWWQRMVCVGSGDGPWCWLSGAHLPGRCTCGVRVGVVFSASGLQQVTQWCSLRLELFGVIWEGTLGPLVLGLSIPPPSLQALHRRAPSASLRTLLSLCPRPKCFWFCFFISDCCAQDCESEKPWRSPHRSKHTRVYLQARACVQVYWQCGAGTSIPRWVFA